MRYKVVHIYWDDAAREIGWRANAEEFEEHFFVHTMGVEVRNDDAFISVARDLSPDAGGMRDLLHIPKGMIKRRRCLGYVEV